MSWGWIAFAATYAWAVAIAFRASGQMVQRLPAAKRQYPRRIISALVWPLAILMEVSVE